jgi:hypothetical protein
VTLKVRREKGEVRKWEGAKVVKWVEWGCRVVFLGVQGSGFRVREVMSDE